jgi:hypothetical protein
MRRDLHEEMLRDLVGAEKDFHFTVEEGSDGSWPIHSWVMTAVMS